MDNIKYDRDLFLQIIESIDGVRQIHVGYDEETNVHTVHYLGRLGKRVIIDTTDEDMYIDTAINYLTNLGLSDLIPNIFPDIHYVNIPIIQVSAQQ